MKKIMFSDKYCLTQAVLGGTKTMTRRLLKDNTPLGNYAETEKSLPYKVGEIVAIAQSYHTLNKSGYTAPEWLDHVCESSAGYENKMFVRADLMPHHIKIIDVKIELLQDISEKDCLCEGIRHYHSSDKRWANDSGYGYHIPKNGLHLFDTPYKAFANLFERISGKGTWENNPLVVAYSFELVD